MEVRDRLRLLVLDAYPPEGRQALREAGATEAGRLYERLLRAVAPDLAIDLGYPADGPDVLPTGAALRDYDGIAWTGSSLTIHDQADVRVQRQIELARAAFAAGVPSFGSCWAAQLAVVAAGGECAPNPRGREFGVARKIALTEAGREHPLFRDKPPVFDALTSHQDEITKLPAGASWLATNGFARVQAVAVEHGAGSFWAVQYHPEYDLREVARLCVVRADDLVAQGSFRDADAAAAYTRQLEALHAEPDRPDLAFALGVDADVLDPRAGQLEVGNWLTSAVLSALRR